MGGRNGKTAPVQVAPKDDHQHKPAPQPATQDGPKAAPQAGVAAQPAVTQPPAPPAPPEWLMSYATAAVRRNNYRKVGRFLARRGLRSHLNAVSGKYGNTLLHEAVSRDACECARVLLEAGASASLAVRSKPFGETPLHMVRSVRMARLLVESGAEVNARSETGLASFAVLFKILSKPAAAPLLRYLLSVGADPSICAPVTLLHSLVTVAAHRSDYPELLQILLEHGADINALASGATPLDMALGRTTKRSIGIMLPLLAAGARWRVRSPLHRADIDEDLVALFLSYGADPDAVEMGSPALNQSRTLNAVVALLCAGANPNAQCRLGHTALYRMLDDMVAERGRMTSAAVILAGGRLNATELQWHRRPQELLATYFGITAATADWRAAVWQRCSAEERQKVRPVAKLP